MENKVIFRKWKDNGDIIAIFHENTIYKKRYKFSYESKIH